MQDQESRTGNLDELILRNGPSPATASIIVSEWCDQGRYDDVVNACRGLLHLYPDDIGLRRLACLAYSALDRNRETLAETRAIMRNMDAFVDIFLLRAKALKRLNRTGEALEALEVYLALRRGDENGLALLEALQADVPGAGRGDSRPTDRTNGDMPPVASATIAELYLSQGLIAEAVRTYRLVVAGDPGDEKSRRRLEELEAEVLSIAGEEAVTAGCSAETAYRAVLEQWRAGCREIFGTTA